ncbi:MAG: glycosyltransferase family 2 protein [Cyclobacteriaceae bacterium]|nr:glycosyltransferase family 2 protein [Cyclobacteriaceae bacterium]
MTPPYQPSVFVIIPAFNEQHAVCKVLADIPKDLVSETIVVNNGSTDHTAQQALACGATVLDEPRKGYGNACLKGIGHLRNKALTGHEIVVFIDADYSDYPEEMYKLVRPIQTGEADLVIGSRALGARQKGAMTPQQLFGNWLATSLMRLIYKINFTDLGPFRAIRYDQLIAINMQDKTYGWTVEMQVKAAKGGLKCTEVPVDYRRRIGVSKVSGTVKGTIMAGYKILWTIAKYM